MNYQTCKNRTIEIMETLGIKDECPAGHLEWTFLQLS